MREGLSLQEAVNAARVQCEARRATGFDQAALDAAAREGFAQGAFEESEEEGAAVVEEFYPDDAGMQASDPGAGAARKVGLAGKLQEKAAGLKAAE